MASGFSHQSTRTKAISSFHTVKGNEQLSVLFHYYLDLIITLTSLLHPVLLPTSFLKLLFSRNLRMKYILSWVSITLCFCFVLALFGLICFSPSFLPDLKRSCFPSSLTLLMVPLICFQIAKPEVEGGICCEDPANLKEPFFSCQDRGKHMSHFLCFHGTQEKGKRLI